MDYDDARRWLERVDPAITKDRSPHALLEELKERSAGGPLTGDAAAAWYALVHEMRRLADYYERDLIRKLRADGMTWPRSPTRCRPSCRAGRQPRRSGSAWWIRAAASRPATCAAAVGGPAPSRSPSPVSTAGRVLVIGVSGTCRLRLMTA
jgi:hypothetical protein